MACGVTLKRSLELDSLLSPESSLKRRRTSMTTGHCAPFRPSFSNSPTHQQAPDAQNTSTHNAGAMPSAFPAPEPKISPEELESYLMSEIHALRRRRMLQGDQASPPLSGGNSDSESEHHMDSAPAGMQLIGHNHPLYRGQIQARRSPPLAQSDRPLFTYKQVRMICERLLKEQEMRLREEYDQVLNARLAEQYDTFVRFTYDQIHRRIDDSPMTYLS